jgi:hypothetical protein
VSGVFTFLEGQLGRALGGLTVDLYGFCFITLMQEYLMMYFVFWGFQTRRDQRRMRPSVAVDHSSPTHDSAPIVLSMKSLA